MFLLTVRILQMNRLILLAVLLPLCFSVTLSAQNPHRKAIVGFYNLENLFDTVNDPLKNDEQFLPDGDYMWTSERYQAKLENLSRVISEMAEMDGGLAVLGVSEVENEQVMLDLAATERLKPYGLKVCHHDSPDRRGVDVAFFYNPARFTVISTKATPLKVAGKPDFITRDQWLMAGVLDKTDTLFILVNHWPSKRGGEKKSMPLRMAAAQLTRHIADSLQQCYNNPKIIIMGDLNDNPDSKSLMDGLKTKTSAKSLSPDDLYNPMWKMYRKGIGSYAYRDSWDMLDNIIVSGSLVNAAPDTYRFREANVFQRNFMFTMSGSYTNYPFRTYAAGVYQGGFSDHLPVYITLSK